MNVISKTLRNLVKQPFFLKKPQKSSCINLLLINKPNSFCGTRLVETNLSDFHKMILTAFKKKKIEKCEPKIVSNRDFKNFSNEAFQQEVLSNMNTYKDYNSFKCMLEEVINLYALEKGKPSIFY